MTIALAGVLALCAQADDEAAREALKKLAGRFQDLRTLSCRVTQSRTTVLLEEPITSAGKLYYRREPGKLVFRMTEPRRTELHFDRKTYQVYRPEEKRLERLEFPDDEVSTYLLMVFQPKPEEIEKRFAVKAGKVVDGKVEVRLDPTDEKVRRRLRRLTLVLEKSNATLRSISYTDPDGDEVRFDLSEITLNPALPPETFKLTVPAGTRILNHQVKPGR